VEGRPSAEGRSSTTLAPQSPRGSQKTQEQKKLREQYLFLDCRGNRGSGGGTNPPQETYDLPGERVVVRRSERKRTAVKNAGGTGPDKNKQLRTEKIRQVMFLILQLGSKDRRLGDFFRCPTSLKAF